MLAPSRVAQAPFDQKAFEVCIKAGAKEYKCLGNMFWQNFLHSATYGTPVNKTSIDDIRKRYLPIDNPPEFWNMDVVVGVPDSKPPPFRSLARLSPEEFSHASLFACHAALATPVNDNIKRKWLRFFRNTAFTFQP